MTNNNTLRNLLPQAQNLVIDGNLYTVDYWHDISKKREASDFSEKEKSQLKDLYQHYQAFCSKRNDENAKGKMREILEIANRVGVDL